MAMDVVDYYLHGDDMQFVEIELDPGEAAIGEAGSMMYMEDGIGMTTVFGDGSAGRGAACRALARSGRRQDCRAEVDRSRRRGAGALQPRSRPSLRLRIAAWICRLAGARDRRGGSRHGQSHWKKSPRAQRNRGALAWCGRSVPP